MKTIAALNIERLKRAQQIFEKFRKNLTTEQNIVGTIQAFEFCYELSWKTIKKIFESEGFTVGTPKNAFRKAALERLIDNLEIWFDFQETRNITSHTYEQEIIDDVVMIFESFSQELDKLIKRLESRL